MLQKYLMRFRSTTKGKHGEKTKFYYHIPETHLNHASTAGPGRVQEAVREAAQLREPVHHRLAKMEGRERAVVGERAEGRA